MKPETETPSEVTLESYMDNNKPKRRTSVLVAHINEIGIMRLANFTQTQIAEYLSAKLGKKVSQGAISLALNGKIGSKGNEDAELLVIERLKEINDRKNRLLLAMTAPKEPVKDLETPTLPVATTSSHPPAVDGSHPPIEPERSTAQAPVATKPKMSKEEAIKRLDAYIKAESSKIGDYIPRKSTSVVLMPKVTETE